MLVVRADRVVSIADAQQDRDKKDEDHDVQVEEDWVARLMKRTRLIRGHFVVGSIEPLSRAIKQEPET